MRSSYSYSYSYSSPHLISDFFTPSQIALHHAPLDWIGLDCPFALFLSTTLTKRMSSTNLSSFAFVSRLCIFALFLLVHCCFLRFVSCQTGGLTPPLPDAAAQDFFREEANRRVQNLTSQVLSSKFVRDYRFCVDNPEADWNKAFNYSSDPTFLTQCMTTYVDFNRRLCTAAEVEVYFENLMSESLRPNRNCNSSHWLPGCEPGWACSADGSEEIDLQNSRDMPARGTECGPCCAGFFCPNGISCMMPCPLGAYCPLAEFNQSSGKCAPYSYRLPSGQPNHACGGANVWADARSSREIFCSAGSYCPTSTVNRTCSSGNYCPLGSTNENRCFKLITCNAGAQNQNIHAYGVMVIAALSTLLLIIYNCSDQIIATRERRYAKSREAAVRTVKEKTQARARWKEAKDAAKKHAIELQSQLSRKFSKKSRENTEEVKILNRTQSETEGDLYPPMLPISGVLDSASEIKSSEPSHYVDMKYGDHDESSIFDVSYSDSSDKHAKKKVLKDKEIHTRSQIFKYAYSQLEREKAQQQNDKMTFSGVLSMATDSGTRKRPLMEITFRDLSVTLKGKHKNLLRSVTGKLKPGRITTVMGPSGAGKTTFLSALAGKTVGCTVSGTIFINGKTASIHSYRKIVGFVPQDDIVHGNLTVEENLWFSARCRLPADLPKPDKVLIVERVIDSLGLQAIRNSLVGTVEKRGISGGQRKRVNVGLELVMEPSLLFLDEPTSGLDSSSSQLLLRALRRETLAGVNVCMVIHQPSYTLFQMFDDLLLLAKGGLTVYHGPVKKVEEYFADLGIIVPERVNPPDYFIDILEGMVKTSSSSGVSYTELPVRWMQHNGYPIPPDLRTDTSIPTVMSSDINHDHGSHELHDSTAVEHSFAGEVWQDVKTNVGHHHERIRHNFLKSTDLSYRRTPNIFLQYKYFLSRVGKQRLRDSKTQAVDYLILLIAGACLGSISKANDATFGFGAYTYTIIGVSLLCKIAALRSFSQDKLQYWRESAAGISSLAHFASKDTVDLFNIVIKPVVYLSMFYFFSNPRSSFAYNYVVLLCLVYCVTGIGYALAIFLEPGPSQLCAVLLPVVLTLISTQSNASNIIKNIANFCFSKWALEAFVIGNAERYSGVWLLTRCGALQRYGYNVHDWALRLALLILAGIASRTIAFLGMIIFKKK